MRIGITIAVGLLAAVCGGVVTAAPTLTLSSAGFERDFNGLLTHSISGLATGETVRIDWIVDLNQNGAADAGDPTLRSFLVTDGVRPIIDGIVNRSVAGDDDAARNGSIRIDYEFPGIDPFTSRQAGKYLIRAAGPSGVAVAPFEIIPPNLPQRIVGIVRNSSNQAPIPYATILVTVLSGGDRVVYAALRCGASGSYTFAAPPGNYELVPMATGYVGTFFPRVLAANETLTADIDLVPAGTAVSGRITDSSAGDPMAGVFVFARLSGGSPQYFAAGLTDVDGKYQLFVNPGAWRIYPAAESVGQIGFVVDRAETPVTVSSAPVTRDFQITRATALLYGKITDASTGAGLANVGVYTFPNFVSNLEGASRSLSNGDYFVGVVGGPWDYETFAASLLGFQNAEGAFSIADGAATRIDILLSRPTAHVRGQVVDGQRRAIGGVELDAVPKFGGASVEQTTAADGTFELQLTGGDWVFRIDSDDALARNLIVPFLELKVIDGIDQTLDYVVPDATGHINGTVKDASNSAVSNVELTGRVTVDGVGYTAYARTDATGAYSLPAINGDWEVFVHCSDLSALNYQCVGVENRTVANDNTTLNFTVQPIGAISSLGGRVVDDLGSEIPGVTLLASSGFGARQTALSGLDGTFEIPVHADSWSLQAVSGIPANYLTPSLSFQVEEGIDIDDIEIVFLLSDCTISGSVKTVTGTAVPGIRIFGSLRNWDDGANYSTLTQTDSSGNFALPAKSGTIWRINFDCAPLDQLGLTCAADRIITAGTGIPINFLVYDVSQLDRPVLEFSEIDSSSPIPAFEFQVVGKPGEYDVFMATTIPFDWQLLTTVTISPGSSAARINIGILENRFFRAVAR